MKTKIYLLFITTLFFCAGCGNKSGGQKQESVSAAKDTYVNPLFPEGADPSALFHNGKYYYTHGTEDKIMLWETSDITDMAHAVCKIVWKPQDPSNSCHLWAPEIHYLFGGWYIYYAAGDKDDIWNIRPYVLHCKGQNPMKDEWEELGMMQAANEDEFSFHAFSLDATVFEHKGDYYYIWAEKTGVGKQISNLYIAKMETPNKLATVQVLLTTPDYDWERIDFWVNEGPAILKHNGKIYMTFSASATGECYCMGMLSIDEDADLLDPACWTKLRYPVLKTDVKAGVFGPGHNSFVKAEDGETDLCVYHARPYDEIVGDPLYDPNRHAMIMKVRYDENDFPVFEYQTMEEVFA